MINRPEIMEGIRRHIQHIGGQENLKILEIEPGHARHFQSKCRRRH